MWLNGKAWVLVQHPKLLKEAEQVKVSWLFNQLEERNDGKWLIEGLGGLQPLVCMQIQRIPKTRVTSVLTKHCDRLIDLHPDSKFLSFKTDSPISLTEAVKQQALIIRRRCAEDVSLYVDLWEVDQVVASTSKFHETHLFYKIKGPEYLFVDSCLMVNK